MWLTRLWFTLRFRTLNRLVVIRIAYIIQICWFAAGCRLDNLLFPGRFVHRTFSRFVELVGGRFSHAVCFHLTRLIILGRWSNCVPLRQTFSWSDLVRRSTSDDRTASLAGQRSWSALMLFGFRQTCFRWILLFLDVLVCYGLLRMSTSRSVAGMIDSCN